VRVWVERMIAVSRMRILGMKSFGFSTPFFSKTVLPSRTQLVIPSRLSSTSTGVATHEPHEPHGGDIIRPSPSSLNKYYHITSITLLALLPVGILIAPSPINVAIDTLLAVAIPTHMYIGMKAVINDYIYNPVFRSFTRTSMLIIAVLSTIGFIKLNTSDVGISQAIKLFWKKTPKSENKEPEPAEPHHKPEHKGHH